MEIFRSEPSVLPGGYGRSGLFAGAPLPRAARGNGAYVMDDQGRWIIEANNNFAALIHGHAHPPTVEAATRALRDGSCYGIAHQWEERLAEHLVGRLRGVDQVKFANSGTEAVMLALRLARAATGSSTVVGVNDAYHGTSETALALRGPRAQQGVPPDVLRHVVSVPVNDVAALQSALEKVGGELAGVIVDLMPNYTGLHALTPEFVAAARAGCDRHGAVLIFDEVISLRHRVGGLQSLYEHRPDLTVMGKMIGGGLPIGAVAGSESIMQMFDPYRDDCVDSSGTFTGNPVSTAAGLACLEAYDANAVARLNRLGDRLRAELEPRLPAGWVLRGQGSVARPVWNAEGDPVKAARALFWECFAEGVLIMPTGLLTLSTPMDEDVVDRIVEIVSAAARAVAARQDKSPLTEFDRRSLSRNR